MTRDFVYNQVFNGCISAKVSNDLAAQFAEEAAIKYSRGQFNKAVQLIEQSIKDAKKLSKKKKK